MGSKGGTVCEGISFGGGSTGNAKVSSERIGQGSVRKVRSQRMWSEPLCTVVRYVTPFKAVDFSGEGRWF